MKKRTERRHRPPEPADIELTASVQADELEFREFPQAEVSFSGSPGRQSVSHDERRNLPERVPPGVKYRNVQVDYRLATKIADDAVGDETSRGGSGAPEPRKAGPQAPE